MPLTQKRLKEVLHYEPLTGIFTWQVKLNAQIIIGSPAGSISKAEHYIIIGIDKETYLAHRLAFFYMTGKWPLKQIDHKDHNRQHNWWSNLREATHTDNQRNRSISCNNKSGHSGVHWFASAKKWHAFIRTKGKKKHLGSFSQMKDAISARKKAEKLYGYHANTGTVSPHN